ncbi:hypothetical protein ES705_21132 [subsurface metagenome]
MKGMKKLNPLEYRTQFKDATSMAKYINKQNEKFYLAGICVYLCGIDKSLEKIAACAERPPLRSR